jgi:predicted RND superfamily exporter protein
LDLTNTQKLISFSESLCPQDECFLAGSLVSYAEFGSKILSSLFSSFLLSLFLVGLVILYLSLHFGLKPATTFGLIAASFWGPMTLMSLFYALGVSITYVTSLIASIMVGLAGDNAIQFLYRRKSLFANATFYQGSSLFITICMIAISSAFFFSDFVQIQRLGFFMVLGFIFNYIGDVCILKGLNKVQKTTT